MSKLPEGWIATSVGELVEASPKCNCADEAEVGFIPMQLMGTRFLEVPGFEVRRWGSVKKGFTAFANGDVLLARITPCFENGKGGIPQGLPNGVGAGSTEHFVLRPKSQVLSAKYLLALFKTQEFLVAGKASMTGAVGQQRVPKAHVLGYEIPLAPYKEQLRICAKLDPLLSRVDACGARLGRVLQILKRFREAVLEAAVSGRLTEEWRGEAAPKAWQKIVLEDEELEVPSTWVACKLGDATSTSRPLCYGVVQPGPESLSGQKLIRVQDIEHGRIAVENLRTISLHVDRQYQRSRVLPGDLLISVVGSIGRTAVVPDGTEANIARAVARVAPIEGVQAQWLQIWLDSLKLQWWLLRSSKEVARKTLNLSTLESAPLAVPPLQEQHEIVRRVRELFALCDSLAAKCKASVARVEKLTPSVLAKGFRGELVPQDPNDEPAGALLEEMRGLRSRNAGGAIVGRRRIVAPPSRASRMAK